MRVASFEPMSLIDYPNHIAAIVFTPGCALRCPFCHNPELIQLTQKNKSYFENNYEDKFFSFLKTRQGLLDGVSITGGEPTLQPDLIDFMKRIKQMGFLVKLDTNGIFPNKVKEILSTSLVDYWAMDIKHAPDKYPSATGRDIPIEKFQQSAQLIMGSGVEYEFRTTVVPGIHEEKDFIEIGKWISGAQNYYLQMFRPLKVADDTLADRIHGKTIDLNIIQQFLTPYIPSVHIRE